jgi:hypothetical protein
MTYVRMALRLALSLLVAVLMIYLALGGYERQTNYLTDTHTQERN